MRRGGSNPILTRTGCYRQADGGTQANGLLTVIDVAKAEANPSSAAIVSTVNAGCSPVRAVETADGSTLWVSARGDNRVLDQPRECVVGVCRYRRDGSSRSEAVRQR